MSTLLYGYECWRMTGSDITKLSVFHIKSLKRILQIFWLDTISNQQPLARCNQDSMETIIMRRRWRWIEHVMRREQDNITRTALHWKPERKRKRGRPRNSWRRTVEASSIQKLARTDRRGDPSLPSYAPHGIMGMSEWVGTGLATVNITYYFTLQLREFAEGKGWVHIYEKDWALVESFIRVNPYMVP